MLRRIACIPAVAALCVLAATGLSGSALASPEVHHSCVPGPDAYLAHCDLSGANLSGDDLTQADLMDANLHGANLAGTTLTNANLTGVRSGAIVGTPSALPNSQWMLVQGYLVGQSANLTHAVLVGANLTRANFGFANLTDANLSHAGLRGALLNHALLTDTNLTDTRVTHASVEYATLTGDNLTGANFTDSVFRYFTSGGGMTGMPSVLPTNWMLVAGYLIGPKDLLIGANLAGANLTNADLKGSNLDGADLSGATLTGVLWGDTECPDGTNSDNDKGTCVNNLG